jgi:hypothetical protein
MKSIALIAATLVFGSSAHAYNCTLTSQGAVKYQSITLGNCRSNPSELCVEGISRHTGDTMVDQLRTKPDACSALVCQMAGSNVDVGLYYYQTGNKAYVFNHGSQKLLATCE